MSEPSTETRAVLVERDLPFPAAKVWRALTQPHLLEMWLMKTDFAAVADHSFQFRADWGAVDCRVLEVEAEKSVSYTWAAMGLESVVTWTLTPTGTGTLLRLEHTGFRPDQEQAYRGAQHGWTHRFLPKLEEVLGQTD